jgi:hypothetical protein
MFGTANSINKKLLAATTAVLITIFLDACAETSTNKNDCEYDIVETMAEVIDIKPHPKGNGKIEIILDFKASPLAFEKQELGALKGFDINHEFLVRNNIELGNKYSVQVSSITSGDCTPLFISFNHAFE